MPPQGLPRPDKATLDSLFKRLETSLDRAAAARPNPGRPGAPSAEPRRIRQRDPRPPGARRRRRVAAPAGRLGLRLRQHRRRAVGVAGADRALPVGGPQDQPARGRRSDAASGDRLVQREQVPAAGRSASEDLPFGSRGGMAVRYYFPVDGDYFVKIFLRPHLRRPHPRPGEPHQLEVRLNGAKIKQFTVGGAGVGEPDPSDDPQSTRTRATRAQVIDGIVDGLEVKFTAKAGPGCPGRELPEGEPRGRKACAGRRTRSPTYEYAGDSAVLPGVGSVEIRGPFNVTGPGDVAEPRRIFVCRPAAGASSAEEDRCARQILSTLARRAYRRPVTDEDVAAAARRSTRPGGRRATFDAGIETALRRILVEPGVPVPHRARCRPARPRAAPYRISDLELASRLSFFLWSSIPDDELLDAGGARAAAASRRCSSSRCGGCWPTRASRRSSTNFAGQWLLPAQPARRVARSATSFPDFDENLREAFAARDRAVPRQPAARGPQRRRAADRRLHVRQRAAGAALRHPERLRQPLPPRARSPTTRAAGCSARAAS